MSGNAEERHTRTYALTGIDQRLLFGQNDIFLRIIESRFDVNIVARGDRITIDGPPEETALVVRLFDDLVTRIRRADYITEQY
ncbi:MAG: hypothetical protein D6800_02015, partial [Candidatus Zixiibacteriota bacterium]